MGLYLGSEENSSEMFQTRLRILLKAISECNLGKSLRKLDLGYALSLPEEVALNLLDEFGLKYLTIMFHSGSMSLMTKYRLKS